MRKLCFEVSLLISAIVCSQIFTTQSHFLLALICPSSEQAVSWQRTFFLRKCTSKVQSVCACWTVGMLSYESRSTLIRLGQRKKSALKKKMPKMEQNLISFQFSHFMPLLSPCFPTTMLAWQGDLLETSIYCRVNTFFQICTTDQLLYSVRKKIAGAGKTKLKSVSFSSDLFWNGVLVPVGNSAFFRRHENCILSSLFFPTNNATGDRKLLSI